jgi:integrase
VSTGEKHSNAEGSSARTRSVSAEPFETVAESFRQTQLRRKVWENQTALQARKTYALFAESVGNRPLEEYNRRDAVTFKNLLQDLPADYGKAVQYRQMAASEIVASTKDKDLTRLSPRTVQRHIAALSTLWETAIEAGQIGTNIFAGFKFAATKKANEQREMWPEDKLNALFATPIWAGCHSADRRSKPGNQVIKDEKFWLPLIAVFSGMRQEEICQLQLSDVRQEGGIWVFDVNSDSDRKVKTGESIRLVPIHSTLIKAGFLSYVEGQRATNQELVFSQLKRGGADQRLGHNFSKWFTRYRREVGLYRPEMNFHSFRHSATTFMQWSGVLEQIIDKVTGHVRQGETARYTKNFKIEQLRDAVEGIQPKIELSHLIATDVATDQQN